MQIFSWRYHYLILASNDNRVRLNTAILQHPICIVVFFISLHCNDDCKDSEYNRKNKGEDNQGLCYKSKKSLYGKEANVKISYVLTHKNSKKRESQRGKDCLLDSVAVICQGTTESFKNLFLLRKRVTRQIEDITGNLVLQLYLYLYVCIRTDQKHNQGADFHAVKEQVHFCRDFEEDTG